MFHHLPWSRPILSPASEAGHTGAGHDAPAGDQAPEALAVGEGVARPDRAPRPPAREWPREASVALVPRPGAPLDQLSLVSERGVDIHLVEPPGHHREEKYHRGQQRREPECGV